jgi:hypothetical protein
MKNFLVVSEDDQLKKLLKEAIREINLEEKSNQPEKLYTVNAVSKMIGKAHATTKKLVKAGYLKTTADGLILESSISEYLQK